MDGQPAHMTSLSPAGDLIEQFQRTGRVTHWPVPEALRAAPAVVFRNRGAQQAVRQTVPQIVQSAMHATIADVQRLWALGARYVLPERLTGVGVELDNKLHQIPTGKGEILRKRKDAAILAIGATVTPALEAARNLAEKGIEVTVANARFAKPLDAGLIKELTGDIKRLVTVEENALSGGFGNSVIDLLQKSGISDIQVKVIGIPDEFVEQGSQAQLRAKYCLDAEGIARQVLELFPKRRSRR